MFVGRQPQLARLESLLRKVTAGHDSRPGKALLIRGRRRVGKSRLVEEFIERTDVPHLFFAASRRSVRDELRLFAEDAAASTLPGARLFSDIELTSWDAALRLLAAAVDQQLAVVVFDELPYLMESDPGFEGTLQRSFDRELSRKPVLLIGIGSDISMMEALNEYGRPFHQRASEMVVPPLSPAEVGSMLGLDAAAAFDAYLVTGGLPLICAEWTANMSIWDYLGVAANDPTSALLVSGERSLAAEFPTDVMARTVLGAIGSGERTFANIGRAAGDLLPGSLNRSLQLLTQKRIVRSEEPLSTNPPRSKRYHVSDPYLRFWLRFLGPHLDEIERGRGDRVLARITSSWTSWRGRAIEPVIRDALGGLPVGTPSTEVLASSDGTPGVVGGYWTRSNNPEIDVVVADRSPIAKQILAVGSIKWREDAAFTSQDLARLQLHRHQLPGTQADTPLLAVSRAGFEVGGIATFGPDDLLSAYG
ncbi:MAG: ATP-binding protein [Microlunatus sp.]